VEGPFDVGAADDIARKLPSTDLTVLMLGDHKGAGRTFAQKIHERSHRAQKPFVWLRCDQRSLEEALCGRAPAAPGQGEQQGVFELARGGTVFLEEVGAMDLACQAKLLRVIMHRAVTRLGESHPRGVDFRLLASTAVDLEGMVRVGTFRPDLYFRMNGVTLPL
jgi:DNA-binding NtrC family response regulator